MPEAERLPDPGRDELRRGGSVPARLRDRLPDARDARRALREGEWVLVWGIGGGLASAANVIARALGARTIVTSSSDDKLERTRRGREGQPRVAGRGRRGQGGDGRRGADVVVESVGRGDLAAQPPGGRGRAAASRSAARRAGRTRRRRSTASGGSSSRSTARRWGRRTDFEGVYELVTSGRAKPIVDAVFPLSEARAAHERMEAGDQLGKIVLTIPG